MEKKQRNKKQEKNKHGETFSTREKRFNSPVPKKKTNNWKEYLNYNRED